MQRISRLALLALAVAGASSALVGCQTSGHHDDTRRTASVTVDYDRAYVASRDTEWTTGTETTATRGTIPQGTRVYFSSEPSSAAWQQARVEGHGVVYVRPSDFRRPS